ncbi:DUF169 domain-containing protein [bacterium]|nr:DUF169 domain-containing protein [bacterium]
MGSNRIGITIVKKVPVGIKKVKSPDKHCHFVGQAREGAIFYARGEDISCPLARFYLGLEKNLKKLSRTLISWDDAINEKVALSYLQEGLSLGGGEKYIVYFPYPIPRLDAKRLTGQENLKPDVVIIVDNPQEIMALVQKFSRNTGKRIKTSMSGIGAMCGECTAYPLMTGQANVSLGCYGSRPGVNLSKEELFLALPSDSQAAKILLEEG